MYADLSLENAALKNVIAKKLYDLLSGGRRLQTINVLNESVREGLAIEIDTSLPAGACSACWSKW